MSLPSPDAKALDMRRGACPALSAPMMTGDGLLARIALIDAISLGQLAELCRLAQRHGNGILDISARGNLQVRGLTEISAPMLDTEVRGLNLPLREGLAVEVPPFAGLDETEIVDPRPIAEAIRQAARSIKGLAPKMCVVIDGHGRLRLSHLLADIRLVAVRSGECLRWKLLLGGPEATGKIYGVFDGTDAIATAISLLRELAAMGNRARGRDLANGLPVNTDSTLPVSPFGRFALSNGLHAIGLGPAFGQARAENLMTLSRKAEQLGIRFLKPALDHSLLFFGTHEACAALADFATRNGFIASSADPRGHIAACPGSPACTSATIATHGIASEAAIECADLLDGSFTLHVTGCPKGCAHPEPSALTLCGTADGISLIGRGRAAEPPFASASFADTNASLRRIADLVRTERREGENSAACLARLGTDRLAAAVTSGRP